MPKTTNLNLELTTDDQTLFEDWRLSQNGQNEVGSESNMQLIDAWAGEVNGLLDGVETLLAAI
jgi:hypothetical protein